jgi:hypothetical protein
MEKNGHNGNGKRIKRNVNGQRKWDLKKKHKWNTREKIRRGRHKQKRNEEGKSESNILERSRFKEKKKKNFGIT